MSLLRRRHLQEFAKDHRGTWTKGEAVALYSDLRSKGYAGTTADFDKLHIAEQKKIKSRKLDPLRSMSLRRSWEERGIPGQAFGNLLKKEEILVEEKQAERITEHGFLNWRRGSQKKSDMSRGT
jgi:hypothetical protein